MVENKNTNPFIRTLIARKIELRFLYINSKTRIIFPL